MNLAASLGQCATPSHFLRLGPQATSPPPNNLIPECLDGGVAESKDSCTIWAEANSAVSQACGHVTSEHTQKQGWHGRRLGWRKAVPAVAQWASCPWASADDCSHAGVWALSHHTFNLKESLKSWFSHESSQFLNIGFKKKKNAMQARQNPPAGWARTFCHSSLSSLLALSSVFTGVQRGQRHPIQLPGAVPGRAPAQRPRCWLGLLRVCVSECVCVAENTQAGPRPCHTTFPSAHTQSAFTGLTLSVLGTVTAGSAGSYT